MQTPNYRLAGVLLTIALACTLASGQAAAVNPPGAAKGAGAVNSPGGGIAQPEGPFIKLEAGAATEVRADKDTAQARFPVSLQVASKDVTLKIVKVTLDGQLASDFVDVFNAPTIEPLTEGRLQAILIEMNLAKSPKQGTYTVSIAATNGAKTIPFELQIKVPAAKLRVPKTLIIKQVIPFFCLSPKTEAAPILDVREMTGRSRLTNIDISRLELLNDQGDPIDGRITFEKDLSTVSPDLSPSISYKLVGRFPLGTAKGSVELNSPQLAEALPINFEVRTRLARWIILLVIGIGLLAGNIVRYRLKRKIEKTELTLKAIDLDTRIRKEIERHLDEPFREKLRESLALLNTAVDKGNADDITNATANAGTTLTDALNDLKQRRLAAETSFSQLAELTETRWSVPPSVSEVVAEASDALKTIRAELNNDNVKASGDELVKLRKDLAAKLQEAISPWKVGTVDYLTNRLGAPDIVLPSTVIPRVKVAVDAVNPKVQAITDISPLDAPEQIKTALGALHSAHTNAIQLANGVKLFLATALSDVVAALGPTVKHQDSIERIEERLKALGATLEAGIDRPDDANVKLPQELAELHKAWRDAILAQLPNEATQAQRKEIDDLIGARDYLGAARLAVAISQAASEGRVLGSVGERTTVVAIASPTVEPWMTQDGGVPAPAVVFLQTLREGGAALPLERLRIRTARELMRDTSLLNIILGILLSVGGYFLFADKFLGTPLDLAAVFFWAFGVDITIDALSQTGKALKKP